MSPIALKNICNMALKFVLSITKMTSLKAFLLKHNFHISGKNISSGKNVSSG